MIMNKRDFAIFCLIRAAATDFDISRGDLILLASQIDANEFMSVYSRVEMMTEMQIQTAIAEGNATLVGGGVPRDEFLADVRKMFFADRKTMHLEKKVMAAIEGMIGD